jgi:hypothetical protein
MKHVVALFLLAGCTSTASLTPAVRVNEARVQKTLFATLPDRIYSLSALSDGTHELITAGGRRVVGATGDVIASTEMDAKAIERAFLRARGDFAEGNVLGDERDEAITSDRKSVLVHDHGSGTQLRRFEVGEYVTGLAVANGEIIVYTYPTPDRQGAFRSLDAEGRELARWEIAPASTFSLLDGKILTLDATGFTLHTTRGETVQHFDVSGGEKFQRPMGTRLGDGQWLFAAAGSGYVPYSMITLFSSGGALLYQEIVDGRAYEVLNGTDPGTFFVSVENAVWRYTLAADSSD